MNAEVILIGMLVCSVSTSLVTEAIKILLSEYNKTYHANTLAACASVVIAAALSIGYIVVTGTAVTGTIVVCIVTLVVLSWLCAMLGYDKVMQAIHQMKG